MQQCRTAGYFSDSLGRFLVPSYGEHWGWLIALTGVVGELSFTMWLLIKGVHGQLRFVWGDRHPPRNAGPAPAPQLMRAAMCLSAGGYRGEGRTRREGGTIIADGSLIPGGSS